jgi:hypothetical protein
VEGALQLDAIGGGGTSLAPSVGGVPVLGLTHRFWTGSYTKDIFSPRSAFTGAFSSVFFLLPKIEGKNQRLLLLLLDEDFSLPAN